jgi:small GTP-binding protein
MSEYKIVVCGAGTVDKSALTIQFVQDYFITDYNPTIEDSHKRLLVVDSQNVRLDILDTAGQDDLAPMQTSYMRQGKGFIIAHAIDDRESFEGVELFYRDITRTKGMSNIPVVICGNKCDLEDLRVVSKAKGEELASRLSAVLFETSALESINIDNIFRTLVRETRKQGRVSELSVSTSNERRLKNGKKKNCLLM